MEPEAVIKHNSPTYHPVPEVYFSDSIAFFCVNLQGVTQIELELMRSDSALFCKKNSWDFRCEFNDFPGKRIHSTNTIQRSNRANTYVNIISYATTLHISGETSLLFFAIHLLALFVCSHFRRLSLAVQEDAPT